MSRPTMSIFGAKFLQPKGLRRPPIASPRASCLAPLMTGKSLAQRKDVVRNTPECEGRGKFGGPGAHSRTGRKR